MVEDVGVVAENVAFAEALARWIPCGINKKKILIGFEATILHGRTLIFNVGLGDVQLVLSLKPRAMPETMEKDPVDLSDAFWYRDMRMSSVRAMLEVKQKERVAGAGGNGSEHSFTAALNGSPQDEMLQALGDAYREARRPHSGSGGRNVQARRHIRGEP
ncbi:hypothetical protein DL767_009883 [Monosporascus sp. MG133]|nr:hypothetical protein DL767_009883 [Monosporascus sp. MG133]